MVLFFIFAAFWAEGQGMHLSANSIGHLLTDTQATDLSKLTNFYDETLSHYLWHFGIVGLSAMLIFRSWTEPALQATKLTWLVYLAGVIHGFTFFAIVIEAGTAPLGITFAALAVLFVLIWGRNKLRHPITAFFLLSYALALAFFIGWAIYWQGLPQFSQVGIL